MKILYIYRDYKGRRKKYGQMMEKLGHTVKYLQILEKKIKNQVHIGHIKKYSPNIVWIYTPSYILYNVISDETIDYLKRKNIPIVMYNTYYPDFPYIDNLNDWKKIDYLFIHDKGMHNFLKNKGLNSYYMPLAFYEDQYYKCSTKKKYDISFMGNALTYLPVKEDKRTIYLQSLKKFNIKVFGEAFIGRLKGINIQAYRGHSIQKKVYGQTIINLDLPFVNYKNKFYKDKIHWKNRIFEVPATGNFLLTIRNEQFLEIFGEDTVGYYDDNIGSLKESINKYLKDKKLRNKMEKKAYKLVHDKHTFFHRFEEMFKIIG